MQADALPLSIDLPSGPAVSGLLLAPKAPAACYVFAHGAGAGMQHRFMADLAGALCGRGIATLRFQFPYMENASKRPDRPEVAHEAVRAAAAEAARRLPDVPLFAGGKSFGGRMTSQAQAARPLAGVAGLVFVGFPLHPAGKPGTDRAAHLSQVQVPMLFLQGDRDELAGMDLMRPEVERLGAKASLHVVAGADHAFHVLARSGRKDPEVVEELADVMARWMGALRAEKK
ncbi:alpha/beta hydrolase family protein [Ramlibacter sp. Leaf400]|uniref:alpha/beta hydrolase family protein n=1 Tax=Ramlibacter sp. Leaf400 TaxID=1736365 RepID=UPI0006FD4D90|nr:alpha/beta family hydrolase [Ramlibacter sp. Leaf400]KQT13185.1 alpha/beta hydrolase [Ramlibacter sp. Leaf400]